MKQSVIGKITVLAGIALVMFAISGVWALYYATGGAGVVVIAAGLLAGAFNLQAK